MKVSVFPFILPFILLQNNAPSTFHWARHTKGEISHRQIWLPLEMCFLEGDSVFVPPGVKQSSSSLPHRFFSNNCFSKGLPNSSHDLSQTPLRS